jgi:hypothetical protein
MNKVNEFASRMGKAPKGAGLGVAALLAGAGLFYGATNSLFTGKYKNHILLVNC